MLAVLTTRTYVFIIVNRLEMLTAKFRFPVIKMLKVSGVKMSWCQKLGTGTVPAVALDDFQIPNFTRVDWLRYLHMSFRNILVFYKKS